MVENEFGGTTLPNCDPSQENCQGSSALEQLGLAHELPIGVNIILLLVIYVVLIAMAYLALFTLVRKRRK